ncbi:hypothetical protein BDV98DRAFT_570448 [Pterulicium gracile]|uniref:Beta/gamma crystallin 'Greek key' domain-containing protein n=1 Tax=Pterulicium gracile TaxID=1884261 RepID=A0A5C3QCZ4_9AGAR|nr:hypothetical protein BDV98DRAFT_570448 [Pterula gracilis]
MRLAVATVAFAGMSSVPALVSGAAFPMPTATPPTIKAGAPIDVASFTPAPAGLTPLRSPAEGRALNAKSLESRNPMDILYACDGANFSGECWNIWIPRLWDCVGVPLEVNNRISSLKINSHWEGMECMVYDSANCNFVSGQNGDGVPMQGAAASALGRWDNRISSVYCSFLEPVPEPPCHSCTIVWT